MTETRTLTVKANPQHWGAGPGTPISRSASEEALARLGWKSVSRKPTECRELVSPSWWISKPTPSVWMHSSSCTCKNHPVDHQKPTEDELLCTKISHVARSHPQKSRPSKPAPVLHRDVRHAGFISLSRYFAPALSTPKPKASDVAALVQACADLDVDAIVHYLFTLDIPINSANHVGTTPLLAAISAKTAPSRPKSHLALIDFLLEAGADPDMGVYRPGAQPTNPICAAVALGLTDVVRLLIRDKADINKPLPAALPVTGSSLKKTRHEGHTRNAGMAPVHIAVFADRPECLEVLLQHGAKADVTFAAPQSTCPVFTVTTPPTSPSGISRPKFHARQTCQPILIKGVTALHLAHGSRRCTEVLLRYRAAVDSRDCQGRTPLHWAVAGGNVQVVEILVAGGADGDASDGSGSTPLSMALGTGGALGVELASVMLEGRSLDETGMRTEKIGFEEWV
ncbi:ankyrin repeat-containing domain protein [Podospora aff. communis PSN243]|uniref:Ankyrin repeat-containing domain protein n=1 Tax=Podospora aff. communis PSN243 TaxID=3040156 RepID=A0AAV9GGB8_9PEZI|nr:ankyrin repeat-containing domain protein [Podospora aff. communis PSN243]